jgi:hypothetical protein
MGMPAMRAEPRRLTSLQQALSRVVLILMAYEIGSPATSVRPMKDRRPTRRLGDRRGTHD